MNALQELELQALQLVGLVVGGLLILALKKAAAWVGLKLRTDQIDNLNVAIDKAMTFGVTKADDVIREKGWDNIGSKNAVIGFALNTIEDKFSHTLADSGLDLTDAGSRETVMQIMERMWPDVAARLSASPATPPAPGHPLIPLVVLPETPTPQAPIV